MSYNVAFAFPAYHNPPNAGPFTQAGVTLNLSFTDSTYSVWDSDTGALASKTFSQIVTFTRASTGTYIDSTGTLQTAAVGAPRFDYNPTTLVANGFLVEEARTNSIRNNLMASAVVGTPGVAPINWGNFAGTFGGLNYSIVEVGTESGITYIDVRIQGVSTGTSNRATFDANTFQSASPGQVWTSSSYFRLVAGSLAGMSIQLETRFFISGAGSTLVGQIFTPTNTPLVSQRVTITGTAGATDNSVNSSVRFGPTNGNTYDFTLRIGLPQLELGAFATSVIPSTPVFTSRASTATYVDSSGLIATAAANVARYQYNPQNLSAPPVLLVETPAATNRLLYTEQFDNALWTKSAGSVTVSANTTVAPDGTTTADTVTANQDTGVYQTVLVSISSTNCQSIFVKAGTATSMMFRDDSGAGRHIVFDPTTGVINSTSGTLVGYGSQAFGNGWWRYWFSYVADAVNIRGWIRPNSAGSGQTFIVWGAQTEAGAFLTSYIPNVSTAGGAVRSADIFTNASVTRAADVAIISTLSPWYNAAEGTMFAQLLASSTTVPTQQPIWSFDDTTLPSENNAYGARTTSIKFRYNTRSSLVNDGDGTVAAPSITAGVVTKTAFAMATNNYIAAVGGTVSTPDTDATVPISISRLSLGGYIFNTTKLNGYLQRFSYYPRRMANYELQALTV